jgi:anti-sigma-K factor RskA
MTHEDYSELLAANALSALSAEEASALEAHLESCADCRTEMDRWQETAAFLALNADALEPSPQVRDRILASVRSSGDNSTVARDRVKSIPRSDEPRVLEFERSRRNVWTSLGSFGAIAAVVALAALLISLAILWRQNRSAEAELARLSSQMREAKEQLAREREIVELLSTPGAHMATLAGTKSAPGAHAMLAYDKNGYAMLMARGLPAAPAGKAYQLWFIMGNIPMPGKVFTTDSSGNGSLQDQIPAEALGSAVFAITLEPESGTRSPTGAIYLRSAT